MDDEKPKTEFAPYYREPKPLERPWLIGLTLIGVKSRRLAVGCAWLLAIICGVGAGLALRPPFIPLQIRILLALGAMVLGALGVWAYVAAIRWMDENKQW
jgi:hypothetical protein